MKRHGDVGLESISSIPISAKKLDSNLCRCAEFKPCAKHLVLAHGEISGHAHRFDFQNDVIELYEDSDGTLYLVNKADKPATIVQTVGTTSPIDLEYLEKCYQAEHLHAPIRDAVMPGEYIQVVFPREYDWHTNEIVRAAD